MCTLCGTWVTVHPHVRGADFRNGTATQTYARFIPTCVGQMSLSPAAPYAPPGSSPRAWGRFLSHSLAAGVSIGSSPRAWGRWRHQHAIDVAHGAVHPHVRGADEHTCVTQGTGRAVHPHVRGADSVPATAVQMCVGSSPRAWGRCSALESASVMLLGSSPRAWGRSPPGRAAAGLYAVHPHVRGADVFPYDSLVRPTRFIPTCVGQMVFRCAFSLTDHGSSPRAWGRYAARVRRLRRGRFIPTCVGQMANEAAKTIAQFGSSPRAWGRFCSAKLAYAPFPVHPHVRGADERVLPPAVLVGRFIPCLLYTSPSPRDS